MGFYQGACAKSKIDRKYLALLMNTFFFSSHPSTFFARSRSFSLWKGSSCASLDSQVGCGGQNVCPRGENQGCCIPLWLKKAHCCHSPAFKRSPSLLYSVVMTICYYLVQFNSVCFRKIQSPFVAWQLYVRHYTRHQKFKHICLLETPSITRNHAMC